MAKKQDNMIELIAKLNPTEYMAINKNYDYDTKNALEIGVQIL